MASEGDVRNTNVSAILWDVELRLGRGEEGSGWKPV